MDGRVLTHVGPAVILAREATECRQSLTQHWNGNPLMLQKQKTPHLLFSANQSSVSGADVEEKTPKSKAECLQF